MPGDPASSGGPARRAPSGRPGPPVIWADAAPAPRRRAAQHRRRRPLGQRGAGARARWPPPRRRGRTSASCPSWPSRATRPRTSSSSRASWPTTWPRSKRSRRPPGSARSWSGSSAPHRAGSGWPTPPRSAPAAGWSGVYRKRFLPNYGVFDEQRWFVPERRAARRSSASPGPGWACPSARTSGSTTGPWRRPGRAGADVVVNLNASPYNRGRRAERLAMLSGRVAEAGCAIAYVNQVGGQDELVFDGDSLIVAADGTLVGLGRAVRRGPGRRRPAHRTPPPARRHRAAAAGRGDRAPPGRAARRWRRRRPDPRLSDHAEVYAALVLGTRDYLRKNGFSEAVIGLSGGIDSSLVATIAVDALGADAGARPLHAVALLERGLARRRRRAGRAPGHRPQGGADRGGPRRLRLHAGARCSGASPSG